MNRQAQNTPERDSRAVQSAALRALYDRSEAGEDPAVVLPLLVQARQTLSETDRQTADQATAAEQREWLHKGEKPGPLLTAQLRRPRGCMGIAAVRTPAGSLISNPENIERHGKILCQRLLGASLLSAESAGSTGTINNSASPFNISGQSTGFAPGI